MGRGNGTRLHDTKVRSKKKKASHLVCYSAALFILFTTLAGTRIVSTGFRCGGECGLWQAKAKTYGFFRFSELAFSFRGGLRQAVLGLACDTKEYVPEAFCTTG